MRSDRYQFMSIVVTPVVGVENISMGAPKNHFMSVKQFLPYPHLITTYGLTGHIATFKLARNISAIFLAVIWLNNQIEM